MLTIKVLVNDREINNVVVGNTGVVSETEDGDVFHMYKIVEPEGFSHDNIWHNRELGHENLVSKIFKVIDKRRNNDKIKRWR